MFQLIFRIRFAPNRFCSGPHAQPEHRGRPGPARRLAAVCAVVLLISSASFAANDVSGERSVVPTVQDDEQLRALLLKVEQQIASGHTFFPTDDSALNTWPRVVQQALPPSPEAIRELADFVTRVRNRAVDEKAAGRTDVAIDLALFQDLAKTLLVGAGAPASPSPNFEAAASQPVPEDHAADRPVADAPGTAHHENSTSLDASASSAQSPDLANLTEIGAGLVQTSLRDTAAPDASPTTGAPDMDGGHTAPAAGKTDLAIATPAIRPPTGAPTAQEQSMTAIYVGRGDEMLAIKDISAARRFYEYAAGAGSARAATALAETYDPAFLTKRGVVGVKPDAALAASWYRRAAALGDAEAEARLRILSTQAAK